MALFTWDSSSVTVHALADGLQHRLPNHLLIHALPLLGRLAWSQRLETEGGVVGARGVGVEDVEAQLLQGLPSRTPAAPAGSSPWSRWSWSRRRRRRLSCSYCCCRPVPPMTRWSSPAACTHKNASIWDSLLLNCFKYTAEAISCLHTWWMNSICGRGNKLLASFFSLLPDIPPSLPLCWRVS